jgi:hypothetical protein
MRTSEHKIVENYWIEELPNGVIHLLINCTQREIYYHAFNDTEFLITPTLEEYDNYTNSDIFKPELTIPRENGVIWIQAEQKNKEQLSFYYIPYKKEWLKTKKYL